jgi:hypothetical protein
MSSKKSSKQKKQGKKKSARSSSGHQPEVSSKSKEDVVESPIEQTIVPYDENLLERTRTQWRFGDWHSLAQLELETLQHHPDRAKLALLASAGLLQIGNTTKARQFIRLAQSWGISKKLICQVLAAGIHNSLGRAFMLVGHQSRALDHFESSIAVGDPGADIRLLTQARISQQCSKLGFAVQQQDTFPSIYSSALTFLPAQGGMDIVLLAEHELGEAWAGNTINTVIFRHHGILTHQGRQTTAFYVDAHTMRLVQRDLEKNTIQTNDIHGEYNLRDAHNSISLGVDRAGHLHICYDHHATQLNYRRSIRPNDISAWTDELPMTGKAEDKVTYPTFILPHHGYPLTLLYRDGKHNKGTARIKTYNEEQQSWEDHPHPILDGSELKPWTSNAYWNHPAIGSDGSLHLSFVWRTHTLGKEDRINNINIGYACSLDNGISWQTSRGRSYQLPITPVNAETVYPVSPGSNLINQCSMALDSSNRPHIVFYADDPSGNPQYQHLRYDGKKWHHQIISQRTRPFTLQGKGTLQLPISRPEIVLDRKDNAYIITRGDHSQNKMVATFLSAPNYIWTPNNIQTLWDEDLGFAEPVIDRERWAQDNVLSMLIQHNDQPNHDIDHQTIKHPVKLLEIKFNFTP